MIITLNFKIPQPEYALEALHAQGLAIRSISTGIIVIDDNEDQTAVLLAAWQYSAEMTAWREQRSAELARVDALMRRDESHKRLGLAGLTEEQVLAWEQYAQDLRDGPETVTEVGMLPVWPSVPV